MGRVQGSKEETQGELPPESGDPMPESGDPLPESSDLHVINPQSQPTNLPETTSPAMPSLPEKHTVSGSSPPVPGDQQADNLHEISPSVVSFPPQQKFPATNVSESSNQQQNNFQEIPPPSMPPPPPPPPPSQVPVSGVPSGTIPVAANNPVAEEQLMQQSSYVLIPTTGNPWSSGIFSCHEHPTNAILTTIAPCVTFGQITEILDNGSNTCLVGGALYCVLTLVICHWNIGRRYRRRLRTAYNLVEAPVSDRLSHVIFPLCSLCQEFRELKNQGLDPSLGFMGNVASIQNQQLQQQDAAQNPPANQSMSR